MKLYIIYLGYFWIKGPKWEVPNTDFLDYLKVLGLNCWSECV